MFTWKNNVFLKKNILHINTNIVHIQKLLPKNYDLCLYIGCKGVLCHTWLASTHTSITWLQKRCKEKHIKLAIQHKHCLMCVNFECILFVFTNNNKLNYYRNIDCPYIQKLLTKNYDLCLNICICEFLCHTLTCLYIHINFI